MGEDLALLTDAAHEAGRIARGFWNRAPEIWDKPDGEGPVTEADLAVDTMLRTELMAARPDYGWLSEETDDDPARLHAEHVFIVDPIDGTRAFIEGEPTWAHSLAVARGKRVVAAIVYLPVHDRLYAARLHGGATLNGAGLAASKRTELQGARVLAARPAFEPQNWRDALVPQVKRQFRSSLAYRLSLVGEGRFDAMLTLRPSWEWDVAAGALIVEEAGGRVSDRHLAPLVFNSAGAKVNGVVAGGRSMHAALGGRLFQS